MIVHQTTTDGKIIFTPFECIYCRMDIAGNHEQHCPLKKGPEKIFIPDPVEDYSDPTEPV